MWVSLILKQNRHVFSNIHQFLCLKKLSRFLKDQQRECDPSFPNHWLRWKWGRGEQACLAHAFIHPSGIGCSSSISELTQGDQASKRDGTVISLSRWSYHQGPKCHHTYAFIHICKQTLLLSLQTRETTHQPTQYLVYACLSPRSSDCDYSKFLPPEYVPICF